MGAPVAVLERPTAAMDSDAERRQRLIREQQQYVQSGGAAGADTGLKAEVVKGGLEFSLARPEYFSLSALSTPEARKNADWGTPHQASRPLYKEGACNVGSWFCSEGGFPGSPNRPTTEMFYVMEGEGKLTDLDGTEHPWGPGDTVVLPKGWSGRWDISKPIHKVFVVVSHPETPQADCGKCVVGRPIEQLMVKGDRGDADHGMPRGASAKLCQDGPVTVGAWECTPGGFPVVNRPTTEIFYILEGVCFLTNPDGSAQRVTAGDTVVLPKGWSGRWDVIETIRKVFVVVAE